jgi:hypothetical protein
MLGSKLRMIKRRVVYYSLEKGEWFIIVRGLEQLQE